MDIVTKLQEIFVPLVLNILPEEPFRSKKRQDLTCPRCLHHYSEYMRSLTRQYLRKRNASTQHINFIEIICRSFVTGSGKIPPGNGILPSCLIQISVMLCTGCLYCFPIGPRALVALRLPFHGCFTDRTFYDKSRDAACVLCHLDEAGD